MTTVDISRNHMFTDGEQAPSEATYYALLMELGRVLPELDTPGSERLTNRLSSAVLDLVIDAMDDAVRRQRMSLAHWLATGEMVEWENIEDVTA